MSSSEPRQSSGEGFSEVRASSVAQPREHVVSSLDALPSEGQEQHTRRKAALKNHETLPPLISLGDMLIEAPPWLFSAALHMIALILLGLILIAPNRPDELVLHFDTTESLGEDLLGNELDMPLDLTVQEVDSALVPQQLPVIEDLLTVSPTAIDVPSLNTSLAHPTPAIRMALSGREQGMQEALLDAYGGTAATQQAVMEGLRWLERNQGKHGFWSMRGRYADGVDIENHEAATAMALLAFQGAGYTPQSNRKDHFTPIVKQAWTSLLKQQDEAGNFFHTGRQHGQLYTQAMCTIALCELYGMTRDAKYLEPAQRAIDYCVKIQSPEGGWRYFPGTGSDLSVTGWFVMALQSARMAGLEVPSPTLDYVSGFLDSVSRKDGSQYAYAVKNAASKSMTAEGLLCRQYLGWPRSDKRLQRGSDYLVENLPNWERNGRNVYYWYYATQVCHHMEGHHWRAWNNVMRELVPKHQVQEGRERGSWDPKGDRWGNAGGRLFVTCLSIYMLEVYYRHLPIYQTGLLGG